MACDGCAHKKWVKHQLMSNGDVQYVRGTGEPPPDVIGYTRDKHDEWLFHVNPTAYVPCGAGIMTRQLSSVGTMQMGRLCTDLQAQGGGFKTPAQCAGCDLRRDVKASKQSPVDVGCC